MSRRNPYKAVIPIVSGIAYVPNPVGVPTASFAFDSFLEDDKFFLMVWDRSKKGVAGLIGGGFFVQRAGEWEAGGIAAVSGYGPLIYDLAASELNSPVFKSPLKSKYAQDFWTRQGKNSISPMSPGAFKMKYGVGIPRVTPEPAFERKMSQALGESYAYSRPLEDVIKKVRKNPRDLEGRHIPERYLAGLPPALQQQRIRELTESRDAYWQGDYSELPTDRAARKMGLVKQSKYTTEAKERGIEYRGNFHDMAKRTLEFYSGRATAPEVSAFAEALKKSFAKGLAAWKSGGHRPGATAQNWAVARVNSLVVGGKTSWTADKKQFAVLPDAVREKIESMRVKQNPITVEVVGQPPADVLSGKHTRFYQSRAALDRIEEQGREVIPAITFRIEWGYKLHQDARQRGGIRFEKGQRDVVTLVVDATRTQTLSDEAERRRLAAPPLLQQVRSGRVTLYTAHTILHRLGDQIMPAIANLTLMELRYEPNIARGVAAGLVVTDRVERAWRNLAKALWAGVNHFGGRFGAFERWLPTVVDTKACREGWITDSLQALAETVPYRLLYKKGRGNGVKLLSDLPFVPQLEAALTEYIDATLDMLKGYQVEI